LIALLRPKPACQVSPNLTVGLSGFFELDVYKAVISDSKASRQCRVLYRVISKSRFFDFTLEDRKIIYIESLTNEVTDSGPG